MLSQFKEQDITRPGRGRGALQAHCAERNDDDGNRSGVGYVELVCGVSAGLCMVKIGFSRRALIPGARRRASELHNDWFPARNREPFGGCNPAAVSVPGAIVRGMSDKTADRTDRTAAWVETAKAAGAARIAEARGDADAVAWAEKTADMLVSRLRARRAS